ncbi:MAG: hypothetical protein V2I36_14725 [Desulfopila sp.]|nr:hypothetical protein [Desulfopila sp.]
MKRFLLLILVCAIFPCFFYPGYAVAEDQKYEIVFWESVRDSEDAALFRLYLEKYPNGVFAGIAKRKIEEMEAVSQPSTAQTPVHPVVQPGAGSVTPLNNESGIVRVAIFPFRLLEDADAMTAVLSSDLENIFRAFSHCMQITHSYYSLERQTNAQSLKGVKELRQNAFLDNMGIDSRKLWNGSTPNAATLTAIAADLDVDAVVMGAIRVSNPWSDKYQLGYIRAYMLDVQSGEMFKSRNVDTFSDAREVLPRILNKLVAKYSLAYCSQ